MPFSKKETRTVSFIIVAVLVRLFPHPPNVAPITAVGFICWNAFWTKALGYTHAYFGHVGNGCLFGLFDD